MESSIEKNQKQAFLDSEGDAYFDRNIENSKKGNQSLPEIDVIKKYLSNDEHLLEVGCGEARVLIQWNEKIDFNYFGIDPSLKAIEFAKKTFPSGQFSVGTADQLEFADNQFDVVYFGFCLYLVDRADLDSVVSEANRVLKPGGVLIIKDFDVPYPIRNEYAHHEGLYSYKLDYSKVFEALPQFTLIEKLPLSPQGKVGFQESVQERVSISVLYKESEDQQK